MGKEEVNPVILIVAAIVVLALVGYFGFRATQPAQPPAGSYTPGVPPWLDPKNPEYGKAKAPPYAQGGSAPTASMAASPAASHP